MTKRKILTKIIVVAMLVVTALLLVACQPKTPDPEPENKNNVSASHFYILSVADKQLYRCDFNESGQPLGTTYVDWYTLQPECYFGSSKDSLYEYDENGRMIGHTYFGAKMELQFDERGYPERGVGYGNYGTRYEIEYECDDAGRIRKETAKRSNGTVVWEYDEQGRLVREDEGAAYAYDADQITMTLTYDSKPAEIVLTMSEAGDICKFEMTVDYTKPKREWYDWTYDEQGRCVGSEGTPFDRFYYSFVDTCTITYDNMGRIVSAVTDMDADTSHPTDEIRREWEYDALGAIVKTLKYTGEQTGYDSYTTTYFENGVRSEMHYEYYKDEDGVSRLYCHADYVYDVKTGYALSSCSIYHNADGTQRPGHETAYEYDEKNRPISYVYKQYNNGEPDTEEHTYTHYGEGGEVIQLVKKEIDHSWKTEIVTTTDYENEKKVKQTKESRGNDRMSGWELRRFVSVETYDEEGQVVTWDYYVYQGDTLDTLTELIREEHERNDYVEGNDWLKTEQTKWFENGELVSEVFKTYDEQSLIDYEETNYQNGVKSAYTVGDYDSKLRIELSEEGYNTYYTGGRPIAYTTTFYDADGGVTQVEKWEYRYHENCYTAHIRCKTYDKDGNLLSRTTKDFDEEGKLLTEETN